MPYLIGIGLLATSCGDSGDDSSSDADGSTATTPVEEESTDDEPSGDGESEVEDEVEGEVDSEPGLEPTALDPGFNEDVNALTVSNPGLGLGIGEPVDYALCPGPVLEYPGQYLVPFESAQSLASDIQQAQDNGAALEIVAAQRLTDDVAALVMRSAPDGAPDGLRSGEIEELQVGDFIGGDEFLENPPDENGGVLTFDELRQQLGDFDLTAREFGLEPHVAMTLAQSYRFRPGGEPSTPSNGLPPVVIGMASSRTVLVLDTGMPDDHVAFYDNVGFAHGGGEPFVTGDGSLQRESGHGPFAADVIVRATGSSASVGLVRIPSNVGVDYRHFGEGVLLQTLEKVAQGPVVADVLNMSFGSYGCAEMEHLNLGSALAPSPNQILVAAAGNDEDDKPLYPAAFESVIGVGSATSGQKSCFSNWGESVDVWADGDGVVAAYPKTGSNLQSGEASWSGTSFAAPIVAALSLVALESGLDHAAASQILEPNGDVNEFGPHADDLSQVSNKSEITTPQSPVAASTCGVP